MDRKSTGELFGAETRARIMVHCSWDSSLDVLSLWRSSVFKLARYAPNLSLLPVITTNIPPISRGYKNVTAHIFSGVRWGQKNKQSEGWNPANIQNRPGRISSEREKEEDTLLYSCCYSSGNIVENSFFLGGKSWQTLAQDNWIRTYLKINDNR
jgi:hypothetical protein